MEKLELIEKEQEIAQNQIAFDLDNLPIEEMEEEEESSVLPETIFSQQDFEWVGEDVLFVVVKTNSNTCRFNQNLCGRPLIDWVLMAGGNCEKKIVDDNQNIIEVLKGIETTKPFMAVFYSDTPLVNKNLVFKIMDYFSRNRLNAMTLLRGYVFKTQYLKNIDNFILGCLDKFDEKAFMQIEDGKSYAKTNKILQNRILDYHEKNGVTFFDRNSVVVDADVEIESGVIIKQNNVIKENTCVGANTILEEGNVVINSIIGENCSLLASRVCDSKVSNNKDLRALDLIGVEY